MDQVQIFIQEIEFTRWRETHKLFAILDCAQLPDTDWRALQGVDESIRRSLFDGTPDEGLSSVEPLLLDALNPALPQLMTWLVQQEKKQALLLWFDSPGPIGAAQQQLRPLLSVDLPGARDALLRFYDPRVFNKLMQVLSPRQQARFFAIAPQWWTWNQRTAKRNSFERPQQEVARVEKLMLSEAQMQTFSELDVADFVHSSQAALMRDKDKYKCTKDLADSAIAQHVDDHINKAVALGLESEEAVTAYLLSVASVLGWTFDVVEHQQLAAVFQDPQRDESEKLEHLQAYGKAAGLQGKQTT